MTDIVNYSKNSFEIEKIELRHCDHVRSLSEVRTAFIFFRPCETDRFPETPSIRRPCAAGFSAQQRNLCVCTHTRVHNVH